MRKNIKNYTSEIPVNRLINKIQELLASKKADKIMIDYVAGEPIGIAFLISTPRGLMPIRLPARIEGVARVMYGANLDQLRDTQIAQVKRTAWRNIHDWIDAQMALIETEMVKLEEVFLPYMVVDENQTFFERFESGKLKLNSGENNAHN